MKKHLFLLMFLTFVLGMFTTVFAQSITMSNSGWGYDNTNFTVSITSAGAPAGAVVTSTEITTYMGSYVPSYYNMHLTISGTTYNSVGNLTDAVYTDLNGLGANGHEVTITSVDTDAYADYITMSLSVTIYYSVPGAPGAPSNPSPANGTINVALSGSLTWDFGADTETYDLWFGPTGSMTKRVDNQTAGTGSWSYGPLDELTNYEWQIVARNSARLETNGPVWSFTTLLNPISTFPWSESFDGTTFAPGGWLNVKTAGTGTPGIWDRQTSGTYPTCSPHSGAAMARYNCFSLSSGTKGELITPALAIPDGEDYRVKFWMYRDSGYSSNYDLVNVYVNDSATSSGGTLLGTINRYMGFDPVELTAGWYEYTFSFTGTTVNRHIIFEAVSAYGNNIFIDDVTVELIPAVPQFSLNPNVTEWDFETVVINQTKTKEFIITNTGGGTLDVSATWSGQYYRIVEDPFSASLGAGASASFTVEYAPLATGTHTGTVTITHDGGSKAFHYIALNGVCVDPTIYYADLPYTQNFDSVTAPALPLGWSKQVNSTTTYAYVQTYIYSTPLTTPNHIYMTNSSDAAAELVLISTLIDPALNTLRLKFWAKGGSTGYTLLVGTMDNSGSRATFTLYETINLTSTYTQYEVNLGSYVGSDQYIAFKHGLGGTYRSIYIDDVLIEELPDVVEPSALYVSEVGADYAIVGWNENNTPPATQWDIVYGAVGFNPEDGTPIIVTENPYTLDNLSPSTSYHWYVRSDTGSKALSAWAGPGSFTTTALPETVPYYEDFESITTAGSFPIGWTRAGTRWSSQIAPQNYNRFALSGTDYLTCSWSSTTTDWMFSKGIYLDASTSYDFGIWYNTCGTNGWNSFKMHIGTSPSGTAMTTELAGVLSPTNMTYAQLTRTGWQPPSTGVYYVGLQVLASSSPWYMSFDDFSVVLTPTTPVFSISPASKDFGTIVVNTTASQVFTISNTGLGSLGITSVELSGDLDHFELFDENEYTEYLGDPISVAVVFKPVAEGTFNATLTIIDDQAKVPHYVSITGTSTDAPNYGGGDETTPAGGYYFANNISVSAPAKPSYSWITETSNELPTTPSSGSLDDGYWGPIPIGFDFPYYGNTYNELYVSTNGLITFESGSTSISNTTLPNTLTPNNLLALFWDDLRYWEGITHIYYGGTSTAFVITYQDICHYSWSAYDPNSNIVAQVILYSDGKIKMQYQDVVGSMSSVHSATIGIENSDGTKGIQYHYNGTGGPVGTGAKDGGIAIMFGQDPSTLPVELSSFTAVLTADMYVQIAWVAESETNHLGYNVLRNTDNDLETALQLNLGVISSGSSEGTQVSYSFIDTEVDSGSSYYYWLQSMDLDGSAVFYGPLVVEVNTNPDGPEIPLIPLVTQLMEAYPNPFNPSTTIRYQIKEAGDVKIDIYNTRGQKLRSFTNDHSKAGYYQITWDGKDANGKNLSSGVYIYRMTSGKYTSSKKMVLTK